MEEAYAAGVSHSSVMSSHSLCGDMLNPDAFENIEITFVLPQRSTTASFPCTLNPLTPFRLTDEKAEKEKSGNDATTPSRTAGMAIDCSPAGAEGLRSRAGERPKSRVPSRGIATDLGECRPPTKQRNKMPAKQAQEKKQEKKEKRQQGENASGGGHPHYSHTKVRGVSRGYGVSKAYGGGASAHSSSGMYSREGNKSRGLGGHSRGFGGGRGAGAQQYGGASGQYGMMRRGSGQGDAMTIKCDAYSRTGQMGGTMSFGQA